MINFIIVTHGEFGAYLVEAAEGIVGRQVQGVRVVATSSRQSVAEIQRRVEVSNPTPVKVPTAFKAALVPNQFTLHCRCPTPASSRWNHACTTAMLEASHAASEESSSSS